MPQREPPKLSPAMEFLIQRKEVVRRRNKFDPRKDQEEWHKLNDEAEELMKKADEAGGISTKEAYGLMAH